MVINGKGIDPSVDLFEMFLKIDQTNNHEYINGSYMCLQFSLDLMGNASKAGFQTKLVNIQECGKYPDGHYVVALETGIDKKYWMYEPQSDEPLNKELAYDNETEVIEIVLDENFIIETNRSVLVHKGKSIVLKI